MNDLMSVVDWSRAQFALTAMYHWLFVPLTLGLSVIVAVMETIYYRTRDERWLAMTKFWMMLFGVNFAMGVATGIILEFEFGTNWSNYSRFAGVLYVIDVYRRDVLRLEEGESRLPPFGYMAHSYRRLAVGALDSRCQRLDAISCRHGIRSGPDA